MHKPQLDLQSLDVRQGLTRLNAELERFPLRLVLGKHKWGFELQALYIETLLSGDYLRYLPLPGGGLLVFASFVFLMEGLPTILLARRPRWKRMFLLRYAYPRQRYIWVAFAQARWSWPARLPACCSGFCRLFWRMKILLVAVTRLLFFLSQSAEQPFVHAYSHQPLHGKAHAMTKPGNPSGPEITPVAPADTEIPRFRNPMAAAEALMPSSFTLDYCDRLGSEGGTEG